MKSGTRKALMAVALAALAALSACGRKQGVFTVALNDDVIILDPHRHDDNLTDMVLDNIYDRLLEFDPDMRLAPSLATGWDNSDDLTWRFHLRPGVAFHDGRPLTADDVKFSLERAKNGPRGHYLGMVRAVNVVDDLTLEIVTNKPCPVLLNKLTFISIVPSGSPDTIVRPMGTGAYRFLAYRPGQEMDLEANGSYWRGRPRIARVRLSFIDTDTLRLRALDRGQAMLAREIDAKLLERAEHRKALRTASRPGLGVSLLGCTFAKGNPLADLRVREAVYWGTDPGELSRYGFIGTEPADELVSPYVIGYIKQEGAPRPQLDRARALLREAGYGQGFDVVLEMSSATARRVGRVLAAQLGRIGIRATVRGLDWREFNERVNRRQSPFFLIGWACSSGDASDLLDACVHTARGTDFGNANWGGYSNPGLDNMIERCHVLLRSDDRLEQLKRTMAATMADLPLIPLYAHGNGYSYHSRVKFAPRVDGKIVLRELDWQP